MIDSAIAVEREPMDEDDKTRLITRRASRELDADSDKTVAIGSAISRLDATSADGEHTKLFRPKRAAADTGTAAAASAAAGSSGDQRIEDPVVGWLVVVEGPGKGSSLRLGYGMNPIGRSSDERVPLTFGDEEISRKGHAMVTYDPRGRKFYLQHGGGTNLTYLGDQPVLQPTELTGRETIGVGNTRMVFVPFCSAQFDWQD